MQFEVPQRPSESPPVPVTGTQETPFYSPLLLLLAVTPGNPVVALHTLPSLPRWGCLLLTGEGLSFGALPRK